MEVTEMLMDGYFQHARLQPGSYTRVLHVLVVILLGWSKKVQETDWRAFEPGMQFITPVVIVCSCVLWMCLWASIRGEIQNSFCHCLCFATEHLIYFISHQFLIVRMVL